MQTVPVLSLTKSRYPLEIKIVAKKVDSDVASEANPGVVAKANYAANRDELLRRAIEGR